MIKTIVSNDTILKTQIQFYEKTVSMSTVTMYNAILSTIICIEYGMPAGETYFLIPAVGDRFVTEAGDTLVWRLQ